MSLPPFVVRRAAVEPEEGAYPPPFDAEKLSIGRNLGRAAGSRSLGAWEELIPPGRRTSFTHAHLREEELVYVLAGQPTLRWVPPGGEAQEVALEAGDFIAFPAGTGIAHTFWNHTTADALLLVVGERRLGDRVFYPEEAEHQAWRVQTRPHKTWSDALAPTGAGRWPAQRIETARLVLRPWAPEDTPDLWAAVVKNRTHLGRFLDWARGEVPTVDDQLAVVRRLQVAFAELRDLVYGIFLPDGRPIGGCGLHARVGAWGLEIGYWIDQDHEGFGYVTEVSAALTRLAIEVKGVQVVEIHCDPRNVRSSAIPARLGFTHTGTLPGRFNDAAGQPADSAVYSLRAADHPAAPSAAFPCRAWDALGRRLL